VAFDKKYLLPGIHWHYIPCFQKSGNPSVVFHFLNDLVDDFNYKSDRAFCYVLDCCPDNFVKRLILPLKIAIFA